MTDVSAESLVNKIRELIEKAKSQTKAGKLRMIFHEIEYAQNCGVKLEDILNGLNELGLDMKLANFKNELSRIRKERGVGKRLKRTQANVVSGVVGNKTVSVGVVGSNKTDVPATTEVANIIGDVFMDQAALVTKAEKLIGSTQTRRRRT